EQRAVPRPALMPGAELLRRPRPGRGRGRAPRRRAVTGGRLGGLGALAPPGASRGVQRDRRRLARGTRPARGVDMTTTGVLYLERLTAAALRLLADVARRSGDRSTTPDQLVTQPDRLLGLLDHPHTHDAVFGTIETGAAGAPASPFLIFAAALHRAATEFTE